MGNSGKREKSLSPLEAYLREEKWRCENYLRVLSDKNRTALRVMDGKVERYKKKGQKLPKPGIHFDRGK